MHPLHSLWLGALYPQVTLQDSRLLRYVQYLRSLSRRLPENERMLKHHLSVYVSICAIQTKDSGFQPDSYGDNVHAFSS